MRRLCEVAFGHAGMDWEDFVEVDKGLFRPAEVNTLLGDPSRAHSILGWKPHVSFEQMIERMVDADVERVRKD